MNRQHPPTGKSKRPPPASSSRAKKVKMVPEVDEEACREEMALQHDLRLAVEELHVLSSKDIGKLIRDAENGILKYVKEDGSFFEINVERLARHLVKHIMQHLAPSKLDEEHFRYMLSGLRLLHTLCDIACHHSTLARVLVEDMSVQDDMLNLIFHMIEFLSQSGEKINGSSQMVLLYSALFSSSMYLLKALISSEWLDITRVLLAHSKVDKFIITAFTALRVVINSLQGKLPDQRIDSRMSSHANEVYCLYHLCESSLQFLHSLCKQILFREHLVKNKELCGRGDVLQLVQNTLKLSPCEDPHLMNVVYWLKSKVLSIVLHFCEAESNSFLDMASSTTQSKDLVKSTIIEVLKMMFRREMKDHPRGLLQLNAMQLTEIFSGDMRFRNFIVSNFTEVLTRVFSQPQKEFLSNWCSNDHEPPEEELVVYFDPISAAGQVLGFISTSHVQHTTWNNFQASPSPYAYQRSSLLIKILANLACYIPELSEEENAHFINEFLECLQMEFSRLPGGAAERTAAACRNLASLLAHAESLTPRYVHEDDVEILRWFISQLEQPLAAKESNIHRVMEVHISTQCPSPTPLSPSPNEHDRSGNDNNDVSVTLAMVQLDQLAYNENGQNQLRDVVGEDQMTDLSENSGDQNIEPQNAEVLRSVQNEDTQDKKRKRTIMNDKQIDIIEKALLDQPILQRRDGSLQLWAAELSRHGSEVTARQLRNWLSNRKAKQARAAAKDARVHSDGDNALTEKQSGSRPDPKSPESLMDEDYDPSPSSSKATRQKDHRRSVLRISGTKNSRDTVVVPRNRFKVKVGQYVMLTDKQGKEVADGTISQDRGMWFEKNLENSNLCVVDVIELKVPDETKLPYPTEAGTTFAEAQSVLRKMRVLWKCSQLILIQQPRP